MATPGRLLDHIDSTERLRLNGVRYLVLDEADRMMDMGYEKSIASIIDAVTEAKTYGDERRIQAKKEARDERNQFGKRHFASVDAFTAKKKKLENDKYLKMQKRKIDGVEIEEECEEEGENEEDETDEGEDNKPEEESDEDAPNEDIDDVPSDDVNDASKSSSAAVSRPVINIKTHATNTGNNATAVAHSPRYQTVMLSATLTAQVNKLAGMIPFLTRVCVCVCVCRQNTEFYC